MTMHCHQWDALLDDWRDGRLDATAAEACRLHTTACGRCADVLALFEDELLTEHDGVDLADGILARTSGSACGLARRHLGSRPDGDLDPGTTSLLEAHLEHCSDCAALDDILVWAVPAVAELGQVELDPAFTFDVLRATSSARARRRSGAVQRLRERFVGWWENQFTRPGFAWEAAFVATVIAVIVVGTPGSPARNTPRKALNAGQASPTWMLDQAETVVGTVAGTIDGLKTDIDQRRDRTAPNRADLRRHTGNLSEAVVDIDSKAAKVEIARIRRDIDELWETWRTSGSSADAPEDSTSDKTTPQ